MKAVTEISRTFYNPIRVVNHSHRMHKSYHVDNKRMPRDHARLYGAYLEMYLRLQMTGHLPRCSRLLASGAKTDGERQVRCMYRFRTRGKRNALLKPSRMFMKIVLYEQFKNIDPPQDLEWVDASVLRNMIENANQTFQVSAVSTNGLLFEHPFCNIRTGIKGRADIYHQQSQTVIELKYVERVEHKHFAQVLLYKEALQAKYAWLFNCRDGGVYEVVSRL